VVGALAVDALDASLEGDLREGMVRSDVGHKSAHPEHCV
jgi:hypothetical protein